MSEGGSIVRGDGEGERRWFYGGGVHIWKAFAKECNGSFYVLEDLLTRGKTTPLHRHTGHDELLYLIEGELLYMSDGVEHRVTRGATIVTPRGTAHGFLVVSETARLLFVQSPGNAESFYLAASEPASEAPGPVDFGKIAAAGKATGVTEILGPPPFPPHST